MRRHRAYRAQTLVEFAFVVPVFLLMMFGAIEFGWLLFTNHEVVNAAREGARYAAVHGARSAGITDPDLAAGYSLDPNDVRDYILSRVTLADPDALDVAVAEPDGDLMPGNRVEVSVTYVYRPIVGAYIIPDATLDLGATSTMMVHF